MFLNKWAGRTEQAYLHKIINTQCVLWCFYFWFIDVAQLRDAILALLDVSAPDPSAFRYIFNPILCLPHFSCCLKSYSDQFLKGIYVSIVFNQSSTIRFPNTGLWRLAARNEKLLFNMVKPHLLKNWLNLYLSYLAVLFKFSARHCTSEHISLPTLYSLTFNLFQEMCKYSLS